MPEVSQPDAPTTTRQPPPNAMARKHPLDYFDVLAKTTMAIVGVWWAVSSFHQQRSHNEKLLLLQIDQQNKILQSQREMSEAQLASSLLSQLRCDDSPQRLMALLVLDSVSPRQATSIANALARCSQNPRDRQAVQKYSLQSSLNEIKEQFLEQLRVARQYRKVGLSPQAAEEYEKAYNQLPSVYKSKTDEGAAIRARRALQIGDFSEASDLFEYCFRTIETR